MSSAFPKRRFGRLLASFRERDFPRACYRGCSYFFMFRPHSLHASQIAPTAASEPAGQPRLLHPSRTCVVTFARIGLAIHPTTGNWRNEDFHLARFAALSAAHSSSKLFRTRCAVCSPRTASMSVIGTFRQRIRMNPVSGSSIGIELKEWAVGSKVLPPHFVPNGPSTFHVGFPVKEAVRAYENPPVCLASRRLFSLCATSPSA